MSTTPKPLKSASNSYDKPFSKRSSKTCPFKAAGIKHIDYKDTATLLRFVTEGGKILPRRVSGVCASNQKKLVKAIKRARHIGLMPFVGDCNNSNTASSASGYSR